MLGKDCTIERERERERETETETETEREHVHTVKPEQDGAVTHHSSLLP